MSAGERERGGCYCVHVHALRSSRALPHSCHRQKTGQGACRADDMAATKAPAAPLAHALAETAARPRHSRQPAAHRVGWCLTLSGLRNNESSEELAKWIS